MQNQTNIKPVSLASKVYPPKAIYIHIPYCISRCDYCDFFSTAGHVVPDEYITAIQQELRRFSCKISLAKVDTLYLGGGNPGLLSHSQLCRLVNASKNVAPALNEITIECNPECICTKKLASLNQAGITRLSLGVQSLNETVLRQIHRSTTAQKSLDALSQIKEHWQKNWSVDLIAGLPLDTKASLEKTINIITQPLGNQPSPPHISLYQLSIEKGTALERRISRRELPYDYEAASDLWIYGRDLLFQKGYRQYEVSNFAIEGGECQHNQHYWQQDSYLGLGAGAVSTIYYSHPSQADTTCKDYCATRLSNENDISKYIARQLSPSPALPQTEPLTANELRTEYYMLALRTCNGISEATYKERFGVPIPRAILQKFDEWQSRGLMTTLSSGASSPSNTAAPDTRHILTANGILLLNALLLEIID